MKFDEMLMLEKEINHKLKVEVNNLNEKVLRLSFQLQINIERKQELESENNNLNNQLDKQALKVIRMQVSSTPASKSQERKKVEDLVLRADQKCREYQQTSTQWELKAKKAFDSETLTRLQYEEDVNKLKGDNERLLQ